VLFHCQCLYTILGDIGFDDREILRDASSFEDSLYKQPDLSHPMDVDDEIQAPMDNDLGPVDGGFMGRWKNIFRRCPLRYYIFII